MPSLRKTFAAIARDIRRQADRRVAQLEKIATTSNNKYVAQGARQRIANIEQAKKGTYINDAQGKRIVNRSNEERTEALQALARELVSTRYASVRGRRNLKSTETQLNAATADASSVYTKAEVKIFYKATQAAWQRPGVKLQDRNAAILEYYGYENLSELVSDVLTMNANAVEASKHYYTENLTPEQREAMEGESDVKEAQSSPDYLREVVSMPEPSGLNELPKA